MRFFNYIFLFFLISFSQSNNDFIDIKEYIPNIIIDLKYASNDNFTGRIVNGYESPICLLTAEAASSLRNIQTILNKSGYSLKIYDAYRPQRSVNHFINWSKNPSDTINKSYYYPNLLKSNLFKLGYIASKSSHSRGSTVDITLVDINSGKEVDMGSPYDFFGLESSHDYKNISITQKNNRKLLLDVMTNNGFSSYPKEWWHYTFIDEPFPTTYFDFTTNK
ncbi:M15 family metallopeptidase [Flavobacteriaceae bacterium]|nr:M15 family metallopeptidase [Flavobacteriaceae bacterium]MDA9631693.1 M15 family metallopeptidase [Bacteroidota bacterium]